MSNYEWTEDQALEALGSVVTEVGSDFTYPHEWKEGDGSCLYVRIDPVTLEEQPACLFGQMFVRLGVPVTVLKHYEHRAVSVVFADLTRTTHYIDGSETTATNWPDDHPWKRFGMLMDQGQDDQDNGAPWGVVVEKIETSMRVPS